MLKIFFQKNFFTEKSKYFEKENGKYFFQKLTFCKNYVNKMFKNNLIFL